MTWILATDHRSALTPFFAGGTLLILDYRGVLVPTNETRSGARIGSNTRELLDRVTRLYPVVVIASDARREALGSLSGMPFYDIVRAPAGERSATDAVGALRTVGDWKRELEEQLESIPGVEVEDRLFSIAVRYRDAPSPLLAKRAILRATARFEGAQVSGGCGMAEIAMERGLSRWEAISGLRAGAGNPPTIFVGKETGYDPSVIFQSSGLYLGIRVGDGDRLAERFCLRTQPEVDGLLQVLADGAGHRRASRWRPGRRLVLPEGLSRRKQDQRGPASRRRRI